MLTLWILKVLKRSGCLNTVIRKNMNKMAIRPQLLKSWTILSSEYYAYKLSQCSIIPLSEKKFEIQPHQL